MTDALTTALAACAAARQGTTVRAAVRSYDAPSHADGRIRVEYWRGRRCIVLRTDATPYPSRPYAVDAIRDGETDAEARDRFVITQVDAGTDMVVLDSNDDDTALTLPEGVEV